MRKVDYFQIEDTSNARLQASKKGLERFQEAAYGLSVHWGLYSLSTEGNEWILFNNQIPLTTYQNRLNRFNPSRFIAEEWADLMLEAGQKFLVITSKHHDGFCLWDSDLTEFKVTNTPFGRDILIELSQALHDRNLGLHFYYSLVDWTHPAYRTDWQAYVAYYQGQVRELCTSFGQIDGLIFDGYWPAQEFEPGIETDFFAARGKWDLAGTYDLIHELQPDAVVSNNSHIPPVAGEDYQVWELDLPGENLIGFNTTEVGDKPTASWWNINSGWSYQPWNYQLKTAEEILAVYNRARQMEAVFFLNAGPRPFGDIHPEEQRVLREIGQLIRHQESGL